MRSSAQRCRLLFWLAAWLVMSLAACKSRTLDAREAANALADEFADLIDFDNATQADGPPPDSDPDGPQLAAFTAPLLIGAEEQLPDSRRIGYDYEQDFQVLFYSSSGLPNPEQVVGAIVWIRQANKDDEADGYLRIEPPDLWLPDGADPSRWVMRLTARVRRLAQLTQGLSSGLRSDLSLREVPAGFVGLDGNAFQIYCALFSRLPDLTERVGNYVIWNLSTYPDAAGDNKIDLCTCQARFQDNRLVESNVEPLGDCDPFVTQAFEPRPNDAPSPCEVWNTFIAGRNTNRDRLVELAADPDYHETASILYPVGSRFFREDDEDCRLELKRCGRDEAACATDADCPSADQRCCSGLCRNVLISTAHCGGCDQPVSAGQGCQSGLPCPAAECEQTCTHELECDFPAALCCDLRCFDRLASPEHCGSCFNTCGPTESCLAGRCCPPGGCPVEVVLARWSFGLDVMGGPDLEATSLSPGVSATPFTSLDGTPDPLPSGQDFWLTEQAWDRGTYLAVAVSAMAGYTIQFTRIEFDQASQLLFDGPTGWQLTDELGTPLGNGLVTTEFPAFAHELVDLTILIDLPPDVLSLRWTTSGALIPTVPWGLDNVTVFGFVQQQ